MSDRSATGCARKSTVGDKGYVFIQTHACDCGRRRKHFSHARAACRAFVTDYHHVTLYNFTAVDCRYALLFTFVYLCRAFVDEHFLGYCRALYHATVGGKVALQYGNTARLTKGVFRLSNYLFVKVDNPFQVFLHGLARASHNGSIQQVERFQLLQYGVYAASLVQVFHVGRTCGRQMAKVGCFFADCVYLVKVKSNTAFVCDCGKVEHTVGGATKRHIRRDCVFNCRRRHNITRTNILSYKLHYLHTCMLCKLDTGRINSRNRTIPLQAHTKHFGKAVHGICRIHTRAGAAGRTYLTLEFAKLFFVDFACFICANCLKHTGKRTLFTAHSPCEHRAAADEYGRDIQPRRRH